MNTIKKISGLLAVSLLLGAGNAFGQDFDFNIVTSAKVVTDIARDTDPAANLALEFGNVRRGTVVSANPQTNTFLNTAGGLQRLGTFGIIAAPGGAITLEIPEFVELVSNSPTPVTGNGATIRFNPQISFAGDYLTFPAAGSSSGVPTAVGALELETTIVGNVGEPVTKNAYFVGGTLSAPNAATTVIQPEALGSYQGTLTITASYN